MRRTSPPPDKRSDMFSVAELRIIRHVVEASAASLKAEVVSLDPESDRAVELANDLMVYRNILEKIDEREDV